MPRATNKREFLMQSDTWGKSRLIPNIGNWWISEKMDGMRAVWLPDTRGMVFGKVIFGNLVAEKQGPRNVANKIVSGLWTRYGRPIWAPDSWVKMQLNNGILHMDRCLDGELWLGRGMHQHTTSVVKRVEDIEGMSNSGYFWSDIKFQVFDSPRWSTMYGDGQIRQGKTFKKDLKGVYEWMVANNPTYKDIYREDRTRIETFEHLYMNPRLNVRELPLLRQLNWHPNKAIEEANELMESIVNTGGEGVVFKHGGLVWEPIRTHLMQKLKPYLDDEGTVVGYTDGKDRLEGTTGSVLISWNGKQFGLSGWTDDERDLIRDGKMCAIGDTVTFMYRELSNEGIPKEARFDRVRFEG